MLHLIKSTDDIKLGGVADIANLISPRFKIILTSYNNGPKPQDEIPQVYMQSPVFGLKKKSVAQVYKPRV